MQGVIGNGAAANVKVDFQTVYATTTCGFSAHQSNLIDELVLNGCDRAFVSEVGPSAPTWPPSLSHCTHSLGTSGSSVLGPGLAA